MTNILDTIKQTLGVAKEDTSFDTDIIMYINTSLAILSQLGLDEADKLSIIDNTTTWEQLFGTRTDLEIVKSYIRFKVKSMFDPPTNSAAIDAMKSVISELEWRINNLKTIKEQNVGEVITNG